jgi:hypothetical protein
MFFKTQYGVDDSQDNLSEAAGGESFSGERIQETLAGTVTAEGEPKLRVYLSDQDTITAQLGLYPHFSRIDVWLLLMVSIAFAVTGVNILRNAYTTYSATRHTTLFQIGMLFSSTTMLIYLFYLVPEEISTHFPESIVLIIYFSVCVLITMRLLWKPDEAIQQFKQQLIQYPRPLVWGGLFVFVILFLRFGYANDTGINPHFFMPLLVVVGSHSLLFMLFYERWYPAALPHIEKQPLKFRAALLLGLAIGIAIILRDTYLFSRFSMLVAPDSGTYIDGGADLFSGTTPISHRTIPYLFLNAVTNSHIAPERLIWLQIVVAGLAAWSLISVLSMVDVKLAAVVGVLLFIDLNWADQNRKLLVEGIFISLHLFAFSLFISHHLRRKGTIKTWEFFASGIVYAVIFLVRPLGILLIIPLTIYYRFFTKSANKALILLCGSLLFFAVLIGFNFMRFREPRLFGKEGYTVLSAVYGYHLFEPENGPQSATLHDTMQSCFPSLDYDDVPRYYANVYIFRNFAPCVGNAPRLSDQINSALRETILANPFRYSQAILQDFTSYISHPVGYYTEYRNQESHAVCEVMDYSWCQDVRQDEAANGRQVERAAYYASHVTQIYLLTDIFAVDKQEGSRYIPPQVTSDTMLTSDTSWARANHDLAFFVAWVILCGFLAITLQPLERIMLGGLVLFIAYTLGSSVIVHVYLSRYGVTLSAAHGIMSALFIYKILEIVLGFRAQRTAEESS